MSTYYVNVKEFPKSAQAVLFYNRTLLLLAFSSIFSEADEDEVKVVKVIVTIKLIILGIYWKAFRFQCLFVPAPLFHCYSN